MNRDSTPRFRTPEQIYNEAIHKLILIKKRRMEDGESYKRIRAAQRAIDEMIAKRNEVRKAAQFVKWRENNK
jgi:hypothetical protein